MLSQSLPWLVGQEDALSSFGLEKMAMMTPAQKAQLLAQSRARPKGLAAVQGAGAPPAPAVAPPGRTPLELSATPTGPMQLEPLAGGMAASGFKGSPGISPNLTASQDSLLPQSTGRGVLARSMTGRDSIPGQAAIAERAATAIPSRFNLPSKLAAFHLKPA